MFTSAEYFQSEVPAGTSGAWVIEKVSVPARPYDPTTDPRPDCFKFRPGIYTCLRRDGTQFMTDLYDEWWTQRDGINEALRRGGDVLITGLGLGMVAEAMLRPSDTPVRGITIVELSQDVINLVKPYLDSRYPGKIQIVAADAFTWQPSLDRHFTVGWHDIWPDPYGSVVDSEIAELEERYRAVCDWQGCWPRTYREALIGPQEKYFFTSPQV